MDDKKDIQTTTPSNTAPSAPTNEAEGQSTADPVGGAISGIGYQLRRGIDRMSFEADKRLRAGRVRSESIRLQKQAATLLESIAERVLELDAAGAEIEPSLKTMVDEVRGLRRQAADMATEIEAIHAEQWVEPATPVLPAPAQAPVREPRPVSKPRSQATRTGEPSPAPDLGTQAVCPNCGGPLRPMSVFCPNCGHKL